MKIGVAINSHRPRLDWLKQTLESTKKFDEVHLYVQGIDQAALDEILSWQIPNLSLDIGREEVGIVQGFNRAVEKLESDWLCSFCDDDYFIEENLGRLLDQIRGGAFRDADVIHFPVEVDGGGSWGESSVTVESLAEGNRIPHGSFFRREVFYKAGKYKSMFATDWEFWLRIARHGFAFNYFPNPVYVFRVKDGAYQKQLREIGGIEKMGVEVRRIAAQ